MASRVRFAEVDGPAFDSGGASYHLGTPTAGCTLLYMSHFAEYAVKGRQRRTSSDARAAMHVEVQVSSSLVALFVQPGHLIWSPQTFTTLWRARQRWRLPWRQ